MLRARIIRFLTAALAFLAAVAIAHTAGAAGFALFEQGAKATALGGAFVAQADDPSAMFYNPAGNAFNENVTLMGGPTLIFRPTAKFDGANPYPGVGTTEEQKHATYWFSTGYGVMPLSKGKVNLAVGVWAPYGLGVPWSHPDTYSGRFISQRIDLRQIALGAQLSVKLADWFAVGAGPEFRLSDVKLSQNEGILNPFTNRFVDVAHLSLISQGTPVKVAWGAGILLKPCQRCRIGGAFHSHVDFDYTGYASFSQISTGNPQLDALVKSRLPFGQPVPASTTLQFPDLAIFGVSYDVTERLTVNADGNYTTWKMFDQTIFHIQGLPAQVLPHGFKNTWTVRGGIGYKASDSLWVGGGVLYDQTPQPDEDVGPLLPDSNRTGISAGLGMNLGKMFRVDVSSLFLWFHNRTTHTNVAGYDGTYQTFAILPLLNITGKF